MKSSAGSVTQHTGKLLMMELQPQNSQGSFYAFGNIGSCKALESQQCDSGFFEGVSPTEQNSAVFPNQVGFVAQPFARRPDHLLTQPLIAPQPAFYRSLSAPVHNRLQDQQTFIGHPSGLSPVSPCSYHTWQAPVRPNKYGSIIEEHSSSSDDEMTHPNKYPVAIEEHRRPECGYKRQPVKSGQYLKVMKDNGDSFSIKQANPETLMMDGELGNSQIVKVYRKDMVR